MELRHLRYFVAAAEEGNLKKAAARLHISQPALSVQIQQLEHELDFALFVRGGARGNLLSEAGRVFLDEARKTLSGVVRGVDLARSVADGLSGSLRIGAIEVAETLALPHVVPAFRARYPRTQLCFETGSSAAQLERFRQGDLDIVFAFCPVVEDDWECRALFSLPLAVLLPEQHRLAGLPSLSISDLSGEAMVLRSRSRDPDAFLQIQELFVAAGSALNVVHEVDGLLSIFNFVAMGLGLTLVVDCARCRAIPGVVCRRLASSDFVKTLAMLRKRGVQGPSDRFFRLAAQRLGNRVPDGIESPADAGVSLHGDPERLLERT